MLQQANQVSRSCCVQGTDWPSLLGFTCKVVVVLRSLLHVPKEACECSIKAHTYHITGFPDGSEVRNLPANAGDSGSIPGLERFPEKGSGNPVQYSHLGNPMDRGAWWATVHGVMNELNMTQQLNSNTLDYIWEAVSLLVLPLDRNPM